MKRLPLIQLRIIGRSALVVSALLTGACSTPDADARTGKGAVEYAARPVMASDSTAELSYVGLIAADSRGSTYVADEGVILVFGPNGQVQRRIGRDGEGPGEFRSFGTIDLLPGDSLFVFDQQQQRVTVFRPYSDDVAYTVRLNQTGFVFASGVRPIRGTQGFIGLYRTAVGDVRGTELVRRDVIRVLNPDGSVRKDSVLTLPEPEYGELDMSDGHSYFWPPFARRGLVAFGPDGRIYSAWSDTAQVAIHDVNGRAQGSFRAQVDARPLPLSRTVVDSFANALMQSRPKGPALEVLSRWSTWPVVEEMLVDDASRVWLKLRTEGAAPGTWTAFRETGTRVASVTLPPNAHPRLIRGDRVYAAVLDEVDVPTLVVYQLVPSAPAAGGAS
ncbi:hypothetical protein [Longimicrobium sp.]|uniref:hypothetical protein n=1 Tax=Longimicrobium sp. TaxID=2029185 RepID=UPI002E36DC8D|nr:hypothetical protein [Longimicrobium sp.]HEX6038706.1 hypothetical protein [Longimicrobium sp.]